MSVEQRVTDEQLAEWELYLRNWPDDDWAPELVGQLIAAVREIDRQMWDAVAERDEQMHLADALQQRIDNALAVCAQRSPSVAAVRAALTGTQNDPDQVAADQGRTGLGKD